MVDLDRFWGKVDRGSPNDCWPWLGTINPVTGYGQVSDGRGRTALAHRVAYAAAVGPVAGGKNNHVCHRCDNRRCCNPAHLFLGHARENMDDMVTKGRSSRGVGRPKAKLNDDLVRHIRRRFDAGEPLALLAAEYGVSKPTLWKAATGRTWRHVT